MSQGHLEYPTGEWTGSCNWRFQRLWEAAGCQLCRSWGQMDPAQTGNRGNKKTWMDLREIQKLSSGKDEMQRGRRGGISGQKQGGLAACWVREEGTRDDAVVEGMVTEMPRGSSGLGRRGAGPLLAWSRLGAKTTRLRTEKDTVWPFLKKSNVDLPSDPMYVAKETGNRDVERSGHTHVCSHVICNQQNAKQPKRPWTGEG